MALHLHRADRTDRLADELADLLSSPLADPFAQDVVAVPERGIERWLAQRLSHRLGASAASPGDHGGTASGDGVCAGIRFLRPASLVTLLTGREEDDPWLPDRLVWTVMRAIDEGLGQPWSETLSRHLGVGLDPATEAVRVGRRFAVSSRLARHFHRYGIARPSLLTDWAAGRDLDGARRALPSDLAWQAELWRRVTALIDEPAPDRRHRATVDALREGSPDLDLPARLSLFGHTRLARTEVELLAALGAHREVHLWLPQPSPMLWTSLMDGPAGDGVVPREADRSGDLVGHPLLASLGRDSRELTRVVAGVGSELVEHPAAPSPAESDTLLGWLQQDLRAGRAPDPEALRQRVPQQTDASLTVHAAHGPTRQVEVLREVLVGLLEDDPSLEPRDIVVMCPDIETYAPLIGATFGLGDHGTDAEGVDAHPAHRLRVQLADRALAATNPVMEVAVRVIDLASSRLRVSDVLDLLACAPVRRRFGLDDESLEDIAGWVTDAGVRWGWDAAARSDFGLGSLEANTWRAGLDRVLAGVAVSADGPAPLGGLLPLDDVGSGSIDLAGRLTEALTRLTDGLAHLELSPDAAAWMDGLADLVRSLCEVSTDDAWQLAGLERVLGEVAAAAPADLPLRLADVQALLRESLQARPTRANFRTGTLTVCTLVPMRSVPHRVICLLGVDDGTFPRSPSVDGDDVLARAPLTGERDARSEDRQLLLDAVMAATERLVIVYGGADERTGERRPPAVPIGEIIDAARETSADPHLPAVVHHPLQPFDVRNLAPGALAGYRGVEPFSFDRSALEGALASLDIVAPHPLLPRPLAAQTLSDVTVDDLVALFEHPGRAFLRDRLGLARSRDPEEISDAIPLALDGLGRWAIGDRVLRARLGGADERSAYTAERLRGDLPPGGAGDEILREVRRKAEAIHQQAALALGQSDPSPSSQDVVVELPHGRRLMGTVDGVRETADGGRMLLAASYSTVAAKHEIAAWIRLLALIASQSDGHADQYVMADVGRRDDPAPGSSGGCSAVVMGPRGGSVLGPIDTATARSHLSLLIDIAEIAQQVPLLIPPKAALAYAQGRHRHSTAIKAADREWTGGHRGWGAERDDPWWSRLLGPGAPIAALTTAMTEAKAGPGERPTPFRLLGPAAQRHSDIDATLVSLAGPVYGPLADNRRKA